MSANNNQQQQPAGQPRQPVSYPSPTYGGSPSMGNTQYNYPAPNVQGEQYRDSSTGSNASMSLPSMQAMTSSLGGPVGGGPYYQSLSHPSSYPNVTSDPTGQNMRFALPQQGDARVMSGGRHKKEIKRRTKTGCLTCRKRRIKCDEQHPSCRNCEKSKRECQGYDPIFKAQPGPAAIQPAPTSSTPQGPVMASSNPYGNQPQMFQAGYGGPGMGYDPALSAGSPASGSQQYEFTSAIDPALETVAPSTAAASNNPFSDSQPVRTVQGILDAGGPVLNIPANPDAPSTTNDEIKHLYFSLYVPGLELFLETKWYDPKGMEHLLTDKALMDEFVATTRVFQAYVEGDQKRMDFTSNSEARLCWSLASMVHKAVEQLHGLKSTGLVPLVDDPVEAAHRLNVYEALLTGRVASHNPLTQPVPGSTDHHRLRELEFWYNLGNLVCLRDDDPSSTKDIDTILAAVRHILDGRENRDVLYSMAVVRVLANRVGSDWSLEDVPAHLDEEDNRSKLLVAKQFIEKEASGLGTTNIIRRFCEMFTRTFTPAIKSAGSPTDAAAPAS